MIDKKQLVMDFFDGRLTFTTLKALIPDLNELENSFLQVLRTRIDDQQIIKKMGDAIFKAIREEGEYRRIEREIKILEHKKKKIAKAIEYLRFESSLIEKMFRMKLLS
jgi:hypothetical protein